MDDESVYRYVSKTPWPVGRVVFGPPPASHGHTEACMSDLELETVKVNTDAERLRLVLNELASQATLLRNIALRCSDTSLGPQGQNIAGDARRRADKLERMLNQEQQSRIA